MTKLAQFIEKESKLLERATPGPWEQRPSHLRDDVSIITSLGIAGIKLGNADAAFIANVRTSHAQALAYLAAFEEVYKKHGCTHPEDCGLCFAKRAMYKSNQK